MADTLDGNRLKEISITGRGLSTSMRDSCTDASLDLGIDKVSKMGLTFIDSADLTIFRSKILRAGASIRYGNLHLVSDGLELDGEGGYPQLTVDAASKFVTALRKQTGGKNWGSVSVSAWAASIAKSVGMSSYVQPGLGTKTIMRTKPEDGETAESTWDVLTDIARQTGVWVFEYGSMLVFAKPSWLAKNPWQRKTWALTWDNWEDYSTGLTGMPTYTDKPEDELRESLTFGLVSSDADTARPGDVFKFTGSAIGDMGGVWVARAVSFPLAIDGPVEVECQRAIDPKVEPPRKEQPATETKTPTKTTSGRTVSGGSSGSARITSGLNGAVDRFVSSYSGRAVDFDGAYGAQCVDLVQFYNRDVAGAGTVWGNGKDWFNAAPGSRYQKFPVGGANGEAASKGDIAVWGSSWGGGYGHVAVVLADRGGSLLTLSQNPGPARQMTLGKNGLIGYLRPTRFD